MVIFLLFAASLNVLLWAWMVLPWLWPPARSEVKEWPELSVVIAARNEADNLRELLPALWALDYPGKWEVVLVLDRPEDGSEALAEEWSERAPRLRIVPVRQTPADWAPKKWALEQGIAAARWDRLVFTDADCRPRADWLRGMGTAFAGGAELVVGFGPYQRQPGLLNALIRYETVLTGGLYGGMAARGRAYMAVGRNLGYTKALFARAGGFAAHRDRLSGDDDLLVNAVGTTAETAVLMDAETFTESTPEVSWGAWWRQKVRHLSAGTAYRPGSQLFLGLFHGAHAIFYLSLLLVLLGTQETGWLVGILLARSGLLLLAAGALLRRWRDWSLLPSFLLLDMLYLFYNLLLVPLSLVSQPKWKG